MGAVERGVAVVTGGSRGIGAAVAARCSATGWRVCFSYLADADAADRVDGVAVRADVAVEADVVRLFDAAAALGPITAVVVNAGIVGPRARVSEFSRRSTRAAASPIARRASGRRRRWAGQGRRRRS